MTPHSPAPRHCYIHVPFCARRCTYCDFAIAVRRVVPVEEYLDALQTEWQVRNLTTPPLELDTLYLGGGTPSLLGPLGVRELLQFVQQQATLAPGAEVTLEANPESISSAAADEWQSGGITRLSIGIQSFDDAVLAWMHRAHTAQMARDAVTIARDAGITSFSVDLIFALPTALQRDWERDLHTALTLAPDHISLYGLTIEPHTPLGRSHSRGTAVEAPEEEYEAQFFQAHALLTAAGYEHYEVSNFAKPGKRAVHNSAYWRTAPYLGLGPSAHGYDGAIRRWNTPNYTEWVARLRAGLDPVEGGETLSDANRITESVYLGLRTRDGLDVSAADSSLIDPWVKAGWMEFADPGSPRIRCTPAGWLRLDGLASALTSLRSH